MCVSFNAAVTCSNVDDRWTTSIEHWRNDTEKWDSQHSGRSWSHRHCVHHKFHMEEPGNETVTTRWRAGDKDSFFTDFLSFYRRIWGGGEYNVPNSAKICMNFVTDKTLLYKPIIEMKYNRLTNYILAVFKFCIQTAVRSCYVTTSVWAAFTRYYTTPLSLLQEVNQTTKKQNKYRGDQTSVLLKMRHAWWLLH
jgi:hypothetical protein